ncbi:MAG: bile acid:sodium symporter family protein [Bacteroidota bacterium]
MESSVLSDVILPLSLAIIMLGMGLSLVPDDFRRVIRMPKAAVVGLINQLIVLPLVGFGICVVLDLSPMLAVGMMILAACPGGVTSNLITHVSKGDLALSISLTAVASFITVLTIPFITTLALGYFMNSEQTIESPVADIMGSVFVITIVPVLIGMFVRARAEKFALRMERPMRIASVVIFVAVVLGLIISGRETIVESFVQIGAATILLNIITMLVGFFSARALKLNLPQAITVTVESGIQNGTLAIVIALTLLKQPEISIPPAIYALVMFATGGVVMMIFGSRKQEAKPA